MASALSVGLLTASLAAADEMCTRAVFDTNGGASKEVEGKLLVTAADGGLLILGRDGQLWNITPDQLRERHDTNDPFRPFSAEELGKELQAEFGDGFEIVRTRHYVICTNTGRSYARWCGALFERLLKSFQTFWELQGLPLSGPEMPLPAIVFADARQFAQFAASDAGDAAAGAKGYFSIRTNRMVLYDLTAGSDRSSSLSMTEVNRRATALPFNVATVVHEATHQIAFNCGMHTRYADNPIWLTEGMAMYFETPDLQSRTGWRTVGRINRTRFKQFSDYVDRRRKPDALATLVSGKERFLSANSIEDAYAEAWALTYFLIKTRTEQYVEYLKRISAKPHLVWDSSETRLQEFQAVFGEDLSDLDRQFVRYLKRSGRR